MTAFNLTNQLLNFMAPAAFMAVVLVLLGRILGRFLSSKRSPVHSLWAQIAIVFVVSVALLLAGLVFFGRDGKMASYALLVLGAASCQWVLLRGWRA